MTTATQSHYSNNVDTLYLNNYELDKSDIGLCFITGLTCIPYANRHWAASNENLSYSLHHKVIAVLEYIPVIGILVGLLERIIAFSILFFKSDLPPIDESENKGSSNIAKPQETPSEIPPAPNRKDNATASEFISCVNPTLPSAISQLNKEEAQEFLNRGGLLNIITEEKMNARRIMISKEEQVITGCNSGINRSQVAAAVVKSMGITVAGVLAGGDSGMNPEATTHITSNPLQDQEENFQSATNFEKTFTLPKSSQIGSELYSGANEEMTTEIRNEMMDANKKHYQDYINKLPPTHFITFGSSGPSALRRLLKREGRSLDGFTITYFPWGDEIAHPLEGSNSKPCSEESYKNFATKLRNCFTTVVTPGI